MLSDVKHPAQFWDIIRRFRPRARGENPIGLDIWEKFFSSFNACIVDANGCLGGIDIHNPDLDKDISLEELDGALSLAKRNKSPGIDNVSSEFYKFMSLNGRKYLLNL